MEPIFSILAETCDADQLHSDRTKRFISRHVREAEKAKCSLECDRLGGRANDGGVRGSDSAY